MTFGRDRREQAGAVLEVVGRRRVRDARPAGQVAQAERGRTLGGDDVQGGAEEWSAARERLVARGLVTESGAATPAGRDLRAEVERRTDELAAGPWKVLAVADRARLVELLGEFWVVVLGSGLLPSESTLGIGRV